MQLHLSEFVKGQTVYTIGVYVCDRSRQIFLDYYYSLFFVRVTETHVQMSEFNRQQFS